ncbi:hypothetical protein BJX96DRAFT_162430 [Aspergillus floccosus]
MTVNPVVTIPPGERTISVKLINPVNAGPSIINRFMVPPVPGLETFKSFPSFSFLLEHSSGRKLVWDLGIRKDYTNYSPKIASYIPTTKYTIDVEKNVADILTENGIKGDEIEAVIWRGRNLREIDFDGPNTTKIGRFRAFDYFGDGSFFLLDSPGHAIGHLCGLVRTTTSPNTFILLGGDVCHYAGVFRPSKHLPMPSQITPHPIRPSSSISFCPGSAWEELQRSRDRRPDQSLYDTTFAHDIPLAIHTVGKLQEIDADPNVFVIIAHDAQVRDGVPHFPTSLNNWKEAGWGDALKWAFLRDLEIFWRSKDCI